MPTEIKCPNCAHVFPMEEAMAEDYKKELREKAAAYARQKDEEYQRKLQVFESEKQQQLKAFDAKLAEEKTKLKDDLEENLRKSISADFETKLQMLEGNAKDNAEKLKLAREKELEFLRREESLKVKEEEMELAFQRKMQEQRNELVEQIRKQEAEKNSIKDTEHQLRLKELEKQLDDQKKLADRKSVV